MIGLLLLSLLGVAFFLVEGAKRWDVDLSKKNIIHAIELRAENGPALTLEEVQEYIALPEEWSFAALTHALGNGMRELLRFDNVKFELHDHTLYCNYRYSEPLAYCCKTAQWGLSEDGSLSFVPSIFRYRYLPYIIFPQWYVQKQDQEVGAIVTSFIREFAHVFPAWRLELIDLREFSHLKGDYREWVCLFSHKSNSDLKIFFRLGYDHWRENFIHLESHESFEELLSIFHPIWKSRNHLVFDLRVEGVCYFKTSD